MALTVGIGVIIVAVVVFSTFFGHMFTKSGWHQLKDKMKFHCWQQSKDEMESSDDD
jgi:fatty acid desaturase